MLFIPNLLFWQLHLLDPTLMSQESLRRYLEEQVGLILYQEDTACVRFLISHINEYGYLEKSIECLFQEHNHWFSIEQLERCLITLQGFRPRGIGARTLIECLLLQLPNIEPDDGLVQRLILNHLEDIQERRLWAISQQTGFGIAAIEQAIDLIKTLHPKPGTQY
jgi:RNA polymerase sigma-54 factor